MTTHEFASVDDAIHFLMENLHLDGVPLQFPDVAQYLGKSGDVRALQPLLRALKEGGSYIRASAALGLGYLGKPEAATDLAEAFTHDRALYVRCDAALALGRLNTQDYLPLLIGRFTSENFEVRKRIAMAVARMTGGKALEAQSTLQEMLSTVEMDDLERTFLQSLLEAKGKV
ncbi:MAG TPA: HEAT repeat domain-containing protein [Chloroflexia bacterium]|jgi:HEAT repeat protein